jgi:threonine synthase
MKNAPLTYVSTRGRSPEDGFEDVVLGGLAPDGGLYVPEDGWPKVTSQELAEWRPLPYHALAAKVLSKFTGGSIPEEDLLGICKRAYRPGLFANRDPSFVSGGSEFDGNILDIAPLTWLERWHQRGREKPISGYGILELSNGETLAFKDIGMRLLSELFEYLLEKRDETINILGATSGDTGSAAEYAFRGQKRVRVFMLSPQGRMSEFQRAQMYGLTDSNIFNIAIEGTFDDGQDMVKAASSDLEFKAACKIGAVNSINLARIIAQVVYYFKGYFAATESNEERVSFAIPTGNLGNGLAGHVARMMGLPIGRIVLATNENDVLDTFFRTGNYRPRTSAETFVTSSPSMDISKASNFERFIYDLLGGYSDVVELLFKRLDVSKGGTGYFDLSEGEAFKGIRQRFGIESVASDHANRVRMMRRVSDYYGGLKIDPHTADAVFAACAVREMTEIMVVLATAQVAKFPDTGMEAFGEVPRRPTGFDGIENLPLRYEDMGIDVDALKAYVARVCAG